METYKKSCCSGSQSDPGPGVYASNGSTSFRYFSQLLPRPRSTDSFTPISPDRPGLSKRKRRIVTRGSLRSQLPVARAYFFQCEASTLPGAACPGLSRSGIQLMTASSRTRISSRTENRSIRCFPHCDPISAPDTKSKVISRKLKTPPASCRVGFLSATSALPIPSNPIRKSSLGPTAFFFATQTPV